MDIGELFGFAKELVIQHWTFLVVALLLGMVGNFSKSHLWTKDRAKSSNPRWFWWWGRATLALHAPFAGAAIGLMMRILFGSDTPAGPGVHSAGEHMLYYLGAGVMSSWIFAGWKHFAKSRGMDVEPIDMPGDSIIPLKMEVKEKIAEHMKEEREEDNDEVPPPMVG